MCSEQLVIEHIALFALNLVLIFVNLLIWREVTKKTN